ncbi:MAG TPA: hypothetical protein VKV06_09235 [Acidimicrobiales bacterium]|nr:hypothetical protein [Acidimicrobiales bacterium]
MSQPSEVRDREVLRLRRVGWSFSRISRELHLERPSEAQRMLQRAINGLPEPEQREVREQESSRLDRLAARVTADNEQTPEDRDRRLAAIERLRTSLTTKS